MFRVFTALKDEYAGYSTPKINLNINIINVNAHKLQAQQTTPVPTRPNAAWKFVHSYHLTMHLLA